MPKTYHPTRIENRSGGGIPDVHLLVDGFPVWIELKVATNSNRVFLSPHQIAFNFSYNAKGGLSFFLVKAPSSSLIYSFLGDKGPDLQEKPITEVQGSVFEGPAPWLEALGPAVRAHYAKLLGG